MAKTDVWMPLFIGDYLADTSRLSTEQHGAYLLLIMDYWRNGPPPDDAQVLAQITRMSPDAWSIAQAFIKHFFSIENGVWKHKRIDEELVAAKENKTKAQAKARAAAEARWAKDKNDAPCNAPSTTQAMHEECPSPSPSPLPLKTKSKSKAVGATASRLPADWQPSDDDAEFCQTERPDINAKATADQFRDYWLAQPGAKGRKLDWSATWRNWVRNQRSAQPARAGPPPYLTPNEKQKAWADRITGKNRNDRPDIIDINAPPGILG